MRTASYFAAGLVIALIITFLFATLLVGVGESEEEPMEASAQILYERHEKFGELIASKAYENTFLDVITVNVDEVPEVWSGVSRHITYSVPGRATLLDKVPNIALEGLYSWHLSLRFPLKSTASRVSQPSMTLLTPHSQDSLRDTYPAPVVTQVQSLFGYEWAFPDIHHSEEAGVSIRSNLSVTYQPGFDSQRLIDPIVVDLPSRTQRLTIKFKPIDDFLNVDIIVVLFETHEVMPVIIEDSATRDFLASAQSNRVEWDIPNPIPRKEYVFSVDMKVYNNVFPKVVVYKPLVGIIAWDSYKTRVNSALSVSIKDDVLEGSITYSAGEPHNWGTYGIFTRQVFYQSIVQTCLCSSSRSYILL